jgi:large subunit ribosomal protein L21
MYAVIAAGGKQYKVEEGDVLRIEKVNGNVGDTVTFDKVLLLADGDALTIGQPMVANASVNARIVEQDKAKKIIVFKYKRRKGYRRTHGHRQPYTAVKIGGIVTA